MAGLIVGLIMEDSLWKHGINGLNMLRKQQAILVFHIEYRRFDASVKERKQNVAL